MKTPITILGILFLMASCSNANHNDVAELPQQEKELKADIEKYPDSSLLLDKLVQYYIDNGNLNQGIIEVNKQLKKDSLNADLWDTKARLLFLHGDTTDAIKAYEKTVQLFPAPEYIIPLATGYAQTRNPLALSITDTLLKVPNADAQFQAIFIKGLYYKYCGDDAKAIPYFDKCIQLNYNFLDAYLEKCIALYNLGKYENSLEVAAKTVQIQQSFADGYYWMGKSCEKLNKKTEAIESYKAALNLDPDYIEAKDALGKIGVSQ